MVGSLSPLAGRLGSPAVAQRGPLEPHMDFPMGSRLGHVGGLDFIREKRSSEGKDISFGDLKDE